MSDDAKTGVAYELRFSRPGSVRLLERGEKAEGYAAYPNSKSLLVKGEDFGLIRPEIDVALDYDDLDDEGDHLNLRISDHHIESLVSDIAYHVYLEIVLNRRDVEVLRDFLTVAMRLLATAR